MSEITINEIFYSLDGEGKRAGSPAVFIRTAGCNLRCNYCDTGYALSGNAGVKMSIEDIISKVSEYNCQNVTVTGGEPLCNPGTKDLIKELWRKGYKVIIETNGSMPIIEVAQYCSVCMDWKMPSCGMSEKMLEKNLSILWKDDVLKAVVRKTDLPYLKEFLDTHKLKCPVYISPVFGEIKLSDIADFIKEYHGGNNVRLQVQLHKIIWEPTMRGV